MCRFLAYYGDPIFLEDLVCTPQHSLVRQSLRAEEAKTVTNGDGFGVGWYGEREQPGVYREVMPAWSDDNLLALCANVRSRLFFGHVRAATGGGIARQNCHPFHSGRYLFMHNGQIGGYSALRRGLENRLPDHLYEQRRGATDSELLFLLIVARIEQGLSVLDATCQVLAETEAMMQVLHIQQPLRFSAALADGTQVWAFRFASDKRAPTLYMRPQNSGWAIASEPLGDDAQEWTLIPQGHMVHLDARGQTLREMH
ncbi:class II glutamine amidotransferase [Paucibacter sp. APW11]|uniref:Class II glutamine amidotransferase n=1 Tax=Roseateles aquae TaxID=3077235 RepID=A0ABU3PD94_9BURK|nr:class II glutamine amidotransferase [Paucibacter sp. APW11]MDT9000088.1 class II glutamine amidotransferase [Paucibacter sp. APW11]